MAFASTACFTPLPHLRSLSFFFILTLLLTCFGKVAGAMTFEKQEKCIEGLTPHCQSVVLAVGQIDPETPAQFTSFTKGLPEGTWVALSSPGGSLVGGLKLGLLIRERGFNTIISSTDYSPPNCFSSCAYAFAGGTTRHLPAGSKYGIHQFKGIDKALSDSESQKLSATIASYLDEMGIDHHLLDYAQVTASDKVTVLSLAQAKLLKVDNLGQSPYPRWRLEATAEGQLIALNRPSQSPGKPPITIALVQVPAQASNASKKASDSRFVFLIFYKSDDAKLFSQKLDHQLLINQKSYPLRQAEDWQRKTTGYQASFISNADAMDALSQAPEESTITLSSPVEIVRLGVGGFKSIYLALVRTEGKKLSK